jgi:NTP pyrophosphatase (non-canonical NTP hydrolase)
MFKNIEDFGAIAESNIKQVQEQFDAYQLLHFPKRTPEFFCLELNGEAGELANLEKKQWKGKQIEQERFCDEAADVMIALMNYCNARGVDLGKSVKEKLEKIDKKMLELKAIGEEF